MASFLGQILTKNQVLSKKKMKSKAPYTEKQKSKYFKFI